MISKVKATLTPALTASASADTDANADTSANTRQCPHMHLRPDIQAMPENAAGVGAGDPCREAILPLVPAGELMNAVNCVLDWKGATERMLNLHIFVSLELSRWNPRR